MSEIVEIGFFPLENVDVSNSAVRCPKCNQLYGLHFEHRFYCVHCDPNGLVMKMIVSLKQQLINETEMRMYSESAKCLNDYRENIVEPKIEEMQKEIEKMRQTISHQQDIIQALIKEVKRHGTKFNKIK